MRRKNAYGAFNACCQLFTEMYRPKAVGCGGASGGGDAAYVVIEICGLPYSGHLQLGSDLPLWVP